MFARFLTACLLVSWIGCGKHPSAPAQSAPAATATTPSANLPATPTQTDPALATDEANLTEVLKELTQVVRRFGAEQRRVPKSFEELVANGYLTRVPPAPAGKKFAIDKNLQVYLARQ